ncbi:MAG: leucine-rich repeat protein [Lachnospiraceae bacterium]|nr:leucine-rich repeat protein [Lachnospiraceae bacterium]
MKRKPFQLCGSVVFAMLLLQIIGFTGGKMQEVSVFADDENVITKEYHGFTCKIINEEELIVSGEGKLGSECNVLLSEQNSEGTEYEDVILKSITFEEGIEEIDYSCALYNAELINLPASCTKIHNNFWVNALNHTVNLSPENTQYILEDGVVYSRDQSELIRAAKKEYEKFTIPETVEKIQQYAFSGCKIKDLYFSDNGKITEIGYNAFYGSSYSVDYGCEIETVHIPDYIEVISNGNFNNDTNILLEEGSQLISFYCSSKYGQITDVSFLKNAKRLKNFYIGFASLSDESIEVLKGLEELEEIRVESGMLSQEL